MYASYDKGTWCTSVIMRGHSLCQLYVGMWEEKRNKQYLEMNFTGFFTLNFFGAASLQP